MKNLKIVTTTSEDSRLVKIVGKFVSIDAMLYKHELLNDSSTNPENTIMDLTQVTELDIVGLNTLLQIHRMLSKANANLEVIVSTKEDVFELLSLTKFDQYLNVSIAA